MSGLLALLVVLVLLAGSHTVAYLAGQRRRDTGGPVAVRPPNPQLHQVVRAARRVASADPSMPTDAALRQQELALALDEYDQSREQLE